MQNAQKLLPYIYIILEISEICNKLLTFLKNIAILYLGSKKAPEKIQTEQTGVQYEEVYYQIEFH